MNFKSIKISKQIELALRWLIYLARNEKSSFVSLRFFCNQTKTSFYHLQKINRLLVKNGIIESRKGKSGGYRLKIKPQHISLLNVIEILEGPVTLINCSPQCQPHCSLKNCWNTLSKNFNSQLSRIKISQLT